MPVPVFDINNHILDYIPRKKRKSFWIAWLKGLLSQIDRLNTVFSDFRNGSTDLGYWNSLLSYSSGDRVRTLFGTFESIVNGNSGNNPISDDGSNWILVLKDFIGATKRASFTVQKLSFEHALNERFQGVLTDNGFTGFKQPTSIDAGVGYLPLSDIYLSYLQPSEVSFLVFSDDNPEAGIVYNNSSKGFVFTEEVFGFETSYIAQINIPASVFASLGTVDVATSVVMNFVEKIKRAGTVYNIVTY